MTFSEEPATPAAPFSGDGSIFDHPDVLLSSPTTSERVVDTQSGFLLVIRRMGGRLALTCKRRVGTPPSSSILLTPDESLKLSRALAASTAGLADSEKSGGTRMPVEGRRKLPFSASVSSGPSLSQRLKRPLRAIFGVLVVAGIFFTGMNMGHHAVMPTKAVVASAEDPLSTARVESFTRSFVSQMLDFGASTYRLSQVKAMSAMSPDLIEKYWKETNFPLNAEQLKQLPQSTMVVIDRINQQRTGSDTSTVDVYAQLVRSDARLSSAVHIKLKLGLSREKSICVLDQEDLTSDAR